MQRTKDDGRHNVLFDFVTFQAFLFVCIHVCSCIYVSYVVPILILLLR